MGEENSKPGEQLLQWPKVENELGLFEETKERQMSLLNPEEWDKVSQKPRSPAVRSVVRSISVGSEDSTSAKVGSVEWEHQGKKRALWAVARCRSVWILFSETWRTRGLSRWPQGLFHASHKPSWEFEAYKLVAASVPLSFLGCHDQWKQGRNHGIPKLRFIPKQKRWLKVSLGRRPSPRCMSHSAPTGTLSQLSLHFWITWLLFKILFCKSKKVQKV